MDESGEKHSAFTPGVIIETANATIGKVRVSRVSHMHI